MVLTGRVAEIFADSHQLYSDALDRLSDGDVRDAAEKAWGATLRATDALIIARTGTEPERTPQTSVALRTLAAEDSAVRPLVSRYYSRQGILHGDCFYLGLCEPIPETVRRIRETISYIQEAERLADHA